MSASVRSASVGTSASTNVTVNRPTGLVDGDLMIAIAWSDDSLVHPVAPAGWAQVGTTKSQSGIGVAKVWRKTAASEPSSQTWTVSGGNSASVVWVVAIIGHDTTTPIDAGPTWNQSATASTTRTASAVNPSGADSLLLASFWSLPNFAGADGYTTPAGMTELGDVGTAANPYASSALDAQQLSASGSTGSRTSTATRSAKWMSVAVAIKSGSTPQNLAPPAIVSAETVTAGALALGAVAVTPPAIASDEQVTAGAVVPGPIAIAPPGIATAEAAGSGMVALSLAPPGIPSAEAVPAGVVYAGPTLLPPGIPSAEAVGAGSVAPGPVAISPPAIPSAEQVTAGAVMLILAPPGIGSGEQVGVGVLVVGPISIAPPGIATSEQVTPGAVAPGPVTLLPPGIPSGEAVGVGLLRLTLLPSSIASDEQVTAGAVVPGPITLAPPGIPSAEAVSSGSLTVTIDLARLRSTATRRRVGYELLAIARIPQVSGPPTLLTVDAISWSKLTWSDTLSQPQSLTATARVASLTDPVAQRMQGPAFLATELWLLRESQIVFAGPLRTWRRQGDDVEIVADGLLAYTQRMRVLTDQLFTQVDQHAIAAALIDQWQTPPVAPPWWIGLAHYGIGTSQIAPSGRLRDRTYIAVEDHQVSKRIEELGAVSDGFDTEIDPTTRQLQLWYPRKGVDRSEGASAIVLDHRVITSPDVMCSVSPEDLASIAFGTATSSGADAPLVATPAINADLAAAYGLSAVSGSWSDITEQATLDEHVQALLDARDQALIVPGPRMRVTPDADLGAYDVGDTVALELGRDQLGISGAYRIRRRSVTVESTGVETVDLELV